jgi:hypothetical protein
MTNVTGSGINFARIQGTVTGAIEKMIRCEVSMREAMSVTAIINYDFPEKEYLVKCYAVNDEIPADMTYLNTIIFATPNGTYTAFVFYREVREERNE